MRILVVEDDSDVARRLVDTLKQSGFAVDRAADGEDGFILGETRQYDAAVLDFGLPRLPGIEVLKRWRHHRRDFPVLVLTARNAWPERVDGLNAGADDYMGKPYHAPEVVARLNALIRRSNAARSRTLKLGDITFDLTSGTVCKAGKIVDLTARELQVLTYLSRRADRIVSQRELCEGIYASGEIADSNTIEVYVGRLRRKLDTSIIRTVRGLGYRVGFLPQ